MNEKEIEDRISKLRSDLKTERLDMSFGEIMSLYESKDLFISPEYQRAYRWDDFQKTRFIESILLGIPVPPIFVAENEESKWELVDGLQRISTVLSFFGLLDGKEKLVLTESELIGKPLEGISINELPIKFKLTIKRSVCRVEILKWDSSFDMRYELFNRLNTGGSPLKAQEIRNCVFIGDFNNLLKEIASNQFFRKIIEDIDERQKKYIDEMYFEELILRYFSIIFGDLNIDKNIPEYLSRFMQKVTKNEINISINDEKNKLLRIIEFLNKNSDKKIFRGENNRFSENYYEMVMYLLYKYFDKFVIDPINSIKKIENIKQDEEYKKASGFQTHQKSRLKRKFDRAEEIFND